MSAWPPVCIGQNRGRGAGRHHRRGLLAPLQARRAANAASHQANAGLAAAAHAREGVLASSSWDERLARAVVLARPTIPVGEGSSRRPVWGADPSSAECVPGRGRTGSGVAGCRHEDRTVGTMGTAGRLPRLRAPGRAGPPAARTKPPAAGTKSSGRPFPDRCPSIRIDHSSRASRASCSPTPSTSQQSGTAGEASSAKEENAVAGDQGKTDPFTARQGTNHTNERLTV